VTVEPNTLEGQRRARRGGRLGIITLLAFGTQGFLLVAALREQAAASWITWGVVFVTFVVAFVIEHRREQARRRRDGTPLH
jgi:hypothetical protein